MFDYLKPAAVWHSIINIGAGPRSSPGLSSLGHVNSQLPLPSGFPSPEFWAFPRLLQLLLLFRWSCWLQSKPVLLLLLFFWIFSKPTMCNEPSGQIIQKLSSGNSTSTLKQFLVETLFERPFCIIF